MIVNLIFYNNNLKSLIKSMGSSNSAPAPKQPEIPVQDGTIPEWMASIHKYFYTLPVLGPGLELGNMNRVEPGELIMKEPDSIITMYN